MTRVDQRAPDDLKWSFGSFPQPWFYDVLCADGGLGNRRGPSSIQYFDLDSFPVSAWLGAVATFLVVAPLTLGQFDNSRTAVKFYLGSDSGRCIAFTYKAGVRTQRAQ